MTREDALKVWLPVIQMGVETMPECKEAIDMAIKALEQEPCEDTISRQAALLPYAELRDDDVISVRTIRDNIKYLPAVQPQKVSGWIPCSDRMPEVMDGSYGECSDDVLICVKWDDVITESLGFYGFYPGSPKMQGWWSVWANGCEKISEEKEVIAWMPLPKPYKPQESEDKE